MRLANAQKSVVVFVGAIDDLTVTAYDDTTITLDWTTPSADNPIDYYEVYLNGVFYENTTDDTEGWVVTGLTASTSYNIKLKTVDTLGNKSGFSNEVTKTYTLYRNTNLSQCNRHIQMMASFIILGLPKNVQDSKLLRPWMNLLAIE